MDYEVNLYSKKVGPIIFICDKDRDALVIHDTKDGKFH